MFKRLGTILAELIEDAGIDVASSDERAQPNGGDRPEDVDSRSPSRGGSAPRKGMGKTAEPKPGQVGGQRQTEGETALNVPKGRAAEPGRPKPPVLRVIDGKCLSMADPTRLPRAAMLNHLQLVGGLDHARSLSRSEA